MARHADGLGALSIADIIHDVVIHDLVHIAQAAQLAYAPLEPLGGAMAMKHWSVMTTIASNSRRASERG